ncbi:MAG: protease complex subunit PrcB family protein [Bacillus sp. (in: Bacteria)]|nr:protease complex subunit PrcB family protein [Bacillus sp. (in: firmicutes)]
MTFSKMISLLLTLMVISVLSIGCGTSETALTNEREFDGSNLVKLLNEQLKSGVERKDGEVVFSRHETEEETVEVEEEKEEAPPKKVLSEEEQEDEQDDKDKNDGNGETEENEVIRGNVSFRVISGGDLASKNEDAYQYVMSLQNTDIRDWRIFSNGAEDIIVFSSGLKNTGGYTIEVLSVVNEEGRTVIKVREKSPAPDAMVTQAFTNPTVVIAVDADKLTNVIEVVDEFGAPFQKHGGSAR